MGGGNRKGPHVRDKKPGKVRNMLAIIIIVAAAIFMLAFTLYGRCLEKKFDVDDRRPTPSHTDYDGIDRVPAHPAILFGHHFSSIAGAGPIVGPIIAALAFGWLPALLWVVLGSIFIGGVQDFSALMISIRQKARSIAEIIRETMSPLAFKLFLLFIWLTLVYVLTVFTDLTSDTFVEPGGGGVATASWLFVGLAIGFGLSVYRLKIPVLKASLVFVPLVFLAVWIGQLLPIAPEALTRATGWEAKKIWNIVLLCYCFVASTAPVWLLLQPRDYLSSFLLYSSVLGGFLGVLCGSFSAQYPAFIGWSDPKLGTLFPMLFITVACGACSGFHALVSSGTTSKQLNREGDARKVAYGAMLVEGLVAVIGLTTVIMLPRHGALTGQPPLVIYATGIAGFLGTFGIPAKIGFAFGLLALSTFILTTLDTATRMGRYIFEEFFNLKGKRVRYFSTLITLVLPAFLVMSTLKDAGGNPIPAWKAVWPVFGATNQLMAGLALLVIAVWLKTNGKHAGFVLGGMFFMLVMTVWALVLLIGQYRLTLIGCIAVVLLVLAMVLVGEVVLVLTRLRRASGSF